MSVNDSRRKIGRAYLLARSVHQLGSLIGVSCVSFLHFGLDFGFSFDEFGDIDLGISRFDGGFNVHDFDECALLGEGFLSSHIEYPIEFGRLLLLFSARLSVPESLESDAEEYDVLLGDRFGL